MKKLAVVFLAIALLASFSACTGGKENPPEETTAAVTTQAPEETTPATEAETEAETSTDASSKNEGTENTPDLASAINMEDTSEESPAPLNQWVKATNYATEDGLYHTVYARATKVTRTADDKAYVQECIDANNAAASDYRQIDLEELNLPADVELCVLDYEVYVPEDFPAPEYGLTTPDLDFSAKKIGGGGIPSADGSSVYLALGTVSNMEISDEDITYQPGNTYKFRGYFRMVQGFEDYTFEMLSYTDGKAISTEDSVYSYWDFK